MDRYAQKDAQKKTISKGDTVIVCTNLKTGQREIGTVESFDESTKQVAVVLRDGHIEERALEHVDKPLETVPEQMFERIARHVASVEKTPAKQQEWEKKFRDALNDWNYVPAGRIFTGAGTGQNLTFYNCYVIPSPKDSRHGIVKTLEQMNEVFSRGGGVGMNLSSLRPRYSYVKGVNGRSSGAVSWGSLYSFSTGLIEQGGSRRGALMLILNCWHPDILEFINSKREAGRITNANISVGVTDDFMQAVKEGKDWDLVFPDTRDPLYENNWDGDLNRWKKMGGRVIKYKTVKASEVWDNIVSSAHVSAEPGMYFIDRANYYSNSHYFASLPCTNPCGEQPLPAWGVCNLGHVNLSKHIDKTNKEVMWDKLKQTVHYAIRFQDNVIDATPYFFEENKKQQFSERRVGMGTIGLAEMLIYMELRYGSPDAIKFIDKLYEFIAVAAYEASIELAQEKGAFSQFNAQEFLQSGFMKRMPESVREKVRQHGMRNVTVMTQAPTGTVGTMVGTSTGIEPFYSWTYFRKARLGVHKESIPVAKDWSEDHPGEKLPNYFANAMDLTPEEHVRVQAAVQRWTDSAISKTCNVPADYTIEQTKELYKLMYDLGCKGGTIYRDGSRDEQILATDAKNLGKDAHDQVKKQNTEAAPAKAPVTTDAMGFGIVEPRKRPEMLEGKTYKLKTAYGNLFITINNIPNDGMFEVFAQLGKAGGFFQSQVEAICRLISTSLRSGIKAEEIIKQLKGIRGPDPTWSNGKPMFSIADTIAQVMQRHMDSVSSQQKLNLEPKKLEETKQPTMPKLITEEIEVTVKEDFGVVDVSQRSIADHGNAPICPECADTITMSEGCMKCLSCGYSKC